MPDPTSTPPVEPGQEPVEPTATPTATPTGTPPVEPGQEPVESPTLPEPTPTEPPPPMTPEQQRDHDMKSWIGRRDAELLQKVETNNAALLEQIGQIVPQPAAPTAPVAPDPTEDANAWFKYMLQDAVKGDQTFNETVVKTGTAILQQDELVKTDPTLGKEIYDEISSGRVPINKTLAPEVAASVAVSTAKANILSKRLLTPVNPLGANTPTTEPLGGIAPPAAPPAPPVKLPPMSDLAKDAMKRWNISEEEALKILSQP